VSEVCVVGSFMMDLSLRAPRRPGPGETVIGTEFSISPGGKGFNQAVAAARCGVSTAMVGSLGDDDFGRTFRAAMAAEGIDSRGVRTVAGVGTGVGVPLVEDDGQNSIVVVPRANHSMTVADLAAAAAVIRSAKVLLLQMELPVDVVVEAARLGRQSGAFVVLNPAPAVSGLAPFAGLVDCVVPNESEAGLLTGLSWDGEGPAAAVGSILVDSGAGAVVLTLGERGAYWSRPGHAGQVDAHPAECIDSVGAGDAFCGALAARMAQGASLEEAVRFGNAAGALAVTRAGAAPAMPTRQEIEALLSEPSCR